MSVKVRVAKPEDAQALSALATATFRETFGHLYPPEDFNAHVAKYYAVPRLRAQIEDPDNLVLLAEADGRAVGHAFALPCDLPHPDVLPRHGELGRLYLLKEFQNKGIGQQMLDRVLSFLDERYPGPQCLSVYSENHGAQRLYARYGFHKIHEYEYVVGNSRDREFIYRRNR